MSIFHDLGAWCQHSLKPAMALQTLNVLLGVRPNGHEALAQLLGALDRADTDIYASIPGLHNLRWLLIAPTEKATSDAPRAPRALILNASFDGELDDLLEELVLRAGEDVRSLLEHCIGFEAAVDPAAYLKQHRIPCAYAFTDIGPIAAGHASHEVADATLPELHGAVQTLKDFAAFYAAHPPAQYTANVGALRDAFLAAFGAPPGIYPLHPLEKRQPEEERWVRLASELMRRKQRRLARRMGDGVVRRAVHAKHHGLVHATFRVCEPEFPERREQSDRARSFDPACVRVGLFRNAAAFKAVIRLSNAGENVNPDRQLDARGLAISVDVSALPGRCLGQPGTQDFLLVDHPVFVAQNIRRFVELVALVEIRDVWRKLWHSIRFLTSRGALKQVWIVLRSLLSRPVHPLHRTFHSGVPFQLGQDLVVKYSVQPSRGTRPEPPGDTADEDFLSRALERSLDGGITLDFFVHALPVAGDEALLRRAVEDATVDWQRLGAERVKLATIEIGHQSHGVEARAKEAEEWVFSPWNALEQHRPIGSINRARRLAYRDGAAARVVRPTKSDVAPKPSGVTAPDSNHGGGSKAAE